MRVLSRFLFLALAALLPALAAGQTPDPPVPLTASSTDCSTASSCATLSAPANGVAIALSPVTGTFQAEFEITYNGGRLWSALDMFPPGSTTAAESASAAGQWRGAAGGLVRVRLSTCSSCSVLVTLTPLAQPPTSGGGGAGGGGGTTQDTDDGSIAASQDADLGLSLQQVYNGSAWVRQTIGTAGSAAAQVTTVQGVASMTPLLANPGTAAQWGVYVEDAAETAGGNLSMLGSVRRDTAASSAGTTGDNATINTDANGRVWVNPYGTDATAYVPVRITNGTAFSELSGACTPFFSGLSTAAVLEYEVKASAGYLDALTVWSLDATPVFVKIYNDTAANTDETDTPILYTAVPEAAASGLSGAVVPIPAGASFSAGITIRITTGIALNDTGALTANEVWASGCYR